MDLRIWNSVGRETLGWIGRVEKPSGGSARSRGLRAAWLGWKTFGWTSQVVKPSGGSAGSQSLRAAWPGWKAFGWTSQVGKPSGGSARSQSLRAAWPGWKALGWTSQVGKPSGRLTGEASGVFSGARCNDPVSEHLSPLAYFGPLPDQKNKPMASWVLCGLLLHGSGEWERAYNGHRPIKSEPPGPWDAKRLWLPGGQRQVTCSRVSAPVPLL